MSTMDEVVDGWLKHRLVVQELLEQVDDEQVQYKPWDNAKSLGDLAIHIATSMDMFVKTVKNGEFTPPQEESDYESMRDVREILKKYTETTKQDLKSLSKSQLTDEVEFNKDIAPGSFWLSNAIDHEIHHKGQLFTYARMAGVKAVPFFMKHPSELK
ncbi:DinB family protein [Virgibacillus litoralis]|uniref:Damage-inducible protein DinB n=1 Tax=Virgibacillus litoralis TaxID=578221 RepID=A0ABS4HEX5_9BACI|nr:DinB family protein [Virgibacillus litoralis]MBP1949408.1 putative damage-inducible protein DinB [Virgibacillus litoralis]